jgi:transcriptional regulator with XRE-family HTH domain
MVKLTKALFDKDWIVTALNERCRGRGAQKKFAEDAGVSEQYVSDVRKGRREPDDSILQPLGFERVTLFRRTALAQGKDKP